MAWVHGNGGHVGKYHGKPKGRKICTWEVIWEDYIIYKIFKDFQSIGIHIKYHYWCRSTPRPNMSMDIEERIGGWVVKVVEY